MGFYCLLSDLNCFLLSIAVKTASKLPLATTPTHHQEFGTIIRNRISPKQTDHFFYRGCLIQIC
jgi:hypothetical protein